MSLALEVCCMIALIFSLHGTRSLIRILTNSKIVDTPNSRTNHTSPTPRGGGIAIILSTALASVIYMIWRNDVWEFNSFATLLLAGSLILAYISWLDDKHNIPARWRLLAQLAVITTCTFLWPMSLPFVSDFLPQGIDTIFIILCWIWFTNLYNFMDGIDGLTAIQTFCICVPLFLLTGSPFPLIITMATAGFFYHNRSPAKIFMGDVGSIPLGFILGGLLLSTASLGKWEFALILPLYYLTDSSYTLFKRLVQKKNIWEAHSEHFYQQAVRRGLSHKQVVRYILIANLFIISLAFGSAFFPAYGYIFIILACVCVGVLLNLMRRHG